MKPIWDDKSVLFAYEESVKTTSFELKAVEDAVDSSVS